MSDTPNCGIHKIELVDGVRCLYCADEEIGHLTKERNELREEIDILRQEIATKDDLHKHAIDYQYELEKQVRRLETEYKKLHDAWLDEGVPLPKKHQKIYFVEG